MGNGSRDLVLCIIRLALGGRGARLGSCVATLIVAVTVSVPANAQGIFLEAPGSPFAVGEGTPRTIVSADFNGDGHADLATVNTAPGVVFVLLGTGAGGFAPAPGSPFPHQAGSPARDLALGDFNLDGHVDIAVIGSVPPGNPNPHRVTVLLGNGQGAFTPPIITSLVPSIFVSSIDGPTSLAVGEFNNDGIPDLALTVSIRYDNEQGAYFQTEVVVLSGDGTGGWQKGIGIVDRVFTEPYIGLGATGHHTPESIKVADFNGDGRDDLVFVNPRTRDVSVWLNSGTFFFVAAPGSPFLPEHPALVKIPHGGSGRLQRGWRR